MTARCQGTRAPAAAVPVSRAHRYERCVRGSTQSARRGQRVRMHSHVLGRLARDRRALEARVLRLAVDCPQQLLDLGVCHEEVQLLDDLHIPLPAAQGVRPPARSTPRSAPASPLAHCLDFLLSERPRQAQRDCRDVLMSGSPRTVFPCSCRGAQGNKRQSIIQCQRACRGPDDESSTPSPARHRSAVRRRGGASGRRVCGGGRGSQHSTPAEEIPARAGRCENWVSGSRSRKPRRLKRV